MQVVVCISFRRSTSTGVSVVAVKLVNTGLIVVCTSFRRTSTGESVVAVKLVNTGLIHTLFTVLGSWVLSFEKNHRCDVGLK